MQQDMHIGSRGTVWLYEDLGGCAPSYNPALDALFCGQTGCRRRDREGGYDFAVAAACAR